jgi:hypothetical protein
MAKYELIPPILHCVLKGVVAFELYSLLKPADRETNLM